MGRQFVTALTAAARADAEELVPRTPPAAADELPLDETPPEYVVLTENSLQGPEGSARPQMLAAFYSTGLIVERHPLRFTKLGVVLPLELHTATVVPIYRNARSPGWLLDLFLRSRNAK